MSKKILYIIPRFTTGGAEKLVLEYAKEFPERGYDIAVASVRGAGELLEDFEKTGASIFVGSGNYILTLRRLRTFILDWRPDIIHTHIFSGDVTGWLLKGEGARWISTQHNTKEVYGTWRRLITRWILRSADTVIAVSETVKKSFNASSWMVIPNGIDLLPWLSTPADTLLANDKLRVAIIGRVEPQKGHDILFQALSKLTDIPWELSVFGDGSLVPQLKRDYHLSYIIYQGIADNLPERLADIDIVIAPSRFEGMSLAAMEAMAAGRVVLGSQAAARGLMTEETGYIVSINHPEVIAAALRGIANHRAEARQKAAAARVRARQHFSLDVHVGRLLAVYGSDRSSSGAG